MTKLRARGCAARLAVSIAAIAVTLICMTPARSLAGEKINPYECRDRALKEAPSNASAEQIRRAIDGFRKGKPDDLVSNAANLCSIAVLTLRLDGFAADCVYRDAIAANRAEPAYSAFYAEYLRNFRGPAQPLFHHTERAYFDALGKLRASVPEGRFPCAEGDQSPDCATEMLVTRGLAYLYQREGVPLLATRMDGVARKRPRLFFSVLSKFSRVTSDSEERDSARDFTAEAVFSETPQRVGRDLDEAELRNLIRTKEVTDTAYRLRLRNQAWPTIDLFHRDKHIDDAQITDFRNPGVFNDIQLRENGIGLEKIGSLGRYDLSFAVSYSQIEQEGLVEQDPEAEEQIDSITARAVVSRFFGANKLNLILTLVDQDIDQRVDEPIDRERRIEAATLECHLSGTAAPSVHEAKFGKAVSSRGILLSGGAVRDTERFGDTEIVRQNFFGSVTWRGRRLVDNWHVFDLGIQPALFTSEVMDDRDQNNAQYRTSFNLLYKAIDEDTAKWPRPGFVGLNPTLLHVVVPVRHDLAVTGPDHFENWAVGLRLISTFYVPGLRGATLFASAEGGYERYYKVDESVYTMGVKIGLGY